MTIILYLLTCSRADTFFFGFDDYMLLYMSTFQIFLFVRYNQLLIQMDNYC